MTARQIVSTLLASWVVDQDSAIWARRLRWSRLLPRIVLAATLALASLSLGVYPASAAIIVWDGGGVTNNWSEAVNWSGDVVPAAADVATFDATSIKNATIDVAINVAGIGINAGYTGTITQAVGITVTVGASNYDQADGSFAGGTASIDVNG